ASVERLGDRCQLVTDTRSVLLVGFDKLPGRPHVVVSVPEVATLVEEAPGGLVVRLFRVAGELVEVDAVPVFGELADLGVPKVGIGKRRRDPNIEELASFADDRLCGDKGVAEELGVTDEMV